MFSSTLRSSKDSHKRASEEVNRNEGVSGKASSLLRYCISGYKFHFAHPAVSQKSAILRIAPWLRLVTGLVAVVIVLGRKAAARQL